MFYKYLAIPTDQLLFTVHQFHLMKGSLISLFGFNAPGMQRLSPHPLTQIFKAVFCLGCFRRGRFCSHISSQSCHRLYIKAGKRILRNKIQVLYYSCNSNKKKQSQEVLPLPIHTYISFSGKTWGKQPNLPLLPLPYTTVKKKKKKSKQNPAFLDIFSVHLKLFNTTVPTSKKLP